MVDLRPRPAVYAEFQHGVFGFKDDEEVDDEARLTARFFLREFYLLPEFAQDAWGQVLYFHFDSS
jgi:hypothetical protein